MRIKLKGTQVEQDVKTKEFKRRTRRKTKTRQKGTITQ